MKAGDLIKWEGVTTQVGLVLEADIATYEIDTYHLKGQDRIPDSEKRAKILWDDGSISSVAMWTIEVISSG